MKMALYRLARSKLRHLHGRLSMSVGRAASSQPLCKHYGFGRGTPVDRFYIEAFLSANAGLVRGHVLEIKDDTYSRRFGGERVTRRDVLDIDSANANATIFGDLMQRGVLPASTFDCIILTQTLQFIPHLAAALGELRASLRPGGTLLVTAPGISPLPPEADGSQWCWSFSATGLGLLLQPHFDDTEVKIYSYGNLYAATAFLHGAALEEVSKHKVQLTDPSYPVIVAARARA